MAIIHNRFQTLKEAIDHLEASNFECVVYPNCWISDDLVINAKTIGDPVTCRYSIEYTLNDKWIGE